MKGLVVLLLLSVAPVVSSDAFGAGATPAVGPRVVLGVDAKGSQRHVQLTDRGGPVYPTADITCDGNRRTITLTRTDNVGGKTIATYAVSPKVSEGMLKAVECRLLIPGREIPAASGAVATRTRPDLRDRHWEPGLAADHRVLAGDLCGPGGDGAAGGRDRDRASDAAEHDWCRGRQRPRRGSARAPARRNCLSGNSVTSRGELGVAAIGADDADTGTGRAAAD